MPFDFKKEYKSLYQPKTAPEIITVPPITYAAVHGEGDPNEEDGAYKNDWAALLQWSFSAAVGQG